MVTGTAAGEDGQPRLKLEFEILAKLSVRLCPLQHFLRDQAVINDRLTDSKKLSGLHRKKFRRQFTDSDTELCFLTERELLSYLASDGGESGQPSP